MTRDLDMTVYFNDDRLDVSNNSFVVENCLENLDEIIDNKLK